MRHVCHGPDGRAIVVTLLALGLFSWTAWRDGLLEAILSMAVLALYGILY